jgi:ketosteroid isomerase-like protein
MCAQTRTRPKELTVTSDGFDAAIEAYRLALQAFPKGDPAPVLELFSRRDDVTLANPLGPPCIGRAEVEKASVAAAANFSGGSVRFEEVSRYGTPDLGYVLELERIEARTAGSEDPAHITLRVTTVFRREGDVWKVSHRHADAITTARPIATLTES